LTIKENAPDQVRTWEDNAEQFGRRGRSFMGDGDARTWEDNADEFGTVVNGTAMSWSLAVLVACSVEPGEQGAHFNVEMSGGKVSASAFASRAKVSTGSISAYINAWPKAIAAGAPVPSTDELSPASVGTFPLPARRFNGKGGYVSTRSGPAGGGAKATVESIAQGGNPNLATELAASAPALTTLLDQASPKVVAAVLADMSDKAFENINEAIVAVTTTTPAEVTDTGVKPGYTPSPVKKKVAQQAAGKVKQQQAKEFVDDLIANATPKVHHKPDGQKSPAAQLLEKLQAADSLWNTEVAIHWLKSIKDAVLSYPGPLSTTDEEFVDERIGVMETLIAEIRGVIEAKKGSEIPDTIPENWS
jgi:hypothetical protein